MSTATIFIVSEHGKLNYRVSPLVNNFKNFLLKSNKNKFNLLSIVRVFFNINITGDISSTIAAAVTVVVFVDALYSKRIYAYNVNAKLFESGRLWRF